MKNVRVSGSSIDGPALIRELQHIELEIETLKLRSREIRKKLASQRLLEEDYYNTTIKLYALRLEDNCWYIGMSRDPERRFKRHGKRKGAKWTKLHYPIEMVETRDTDTTDEAAASRLEDAMTIEYAGKYGVDFVRGGGYCQQVPNWPRDLRS